MGAEDIIMVTPVIPDLAFRLVCRIILIHITVIVTVILIAIPITIHLLSSQLQSIRLSIYKSHRQLPS